MKVIVALLSGLVFGFGLILSRMIDPAKVLGFLDIFGEWDPSLAFVMGGGLVVTAIGYRVARGMGAPVAAEHFAWPTRNDLDARLIGGAVMFGAGWGLVGLCPGPALTDITLGGSSILMFVAAMAAGWLAARHVPGLKA